MSSAQPLDSMLVPRFMQPATFFRTPWLKEDAAVDVGLIGVPFDFASNRPGSRFGPAQIREMSRLVRRFNSIGGPSPFDLCTVADLGDAPVIPIDIGRSVELIVQFVRGLAERGISIVAAGGDHGVTYPVIKGLNSSEPLGMVHFDAHVDTYSDAWGDLYNHGTLLRRLVEQNLIDPKRTISVGIHGSRFSLDDRDFHAANGMRLISFDEFETLGRAETVEIMRQVISDKPTYVTFDIDALDASQCIGTGSPEPGGLTMRDAQVLIRGLQGANIIGADVCEVSPPLDPTHQTALNGANLMFELLCLVAGTRASARR